MMNETGQKMIKAIEYIKDFEEHEMFNTDDIKTRIEIKKRVTIYEDALRGLSDSMTPWEIIEYLEGHAEYYLSSDSNPKYAETVNTIIKICYSLFV